LIIPADSSSPGPIHSRSYTLTGLSIATVYEAMILSRNRFGWSKPSVILRFGTNGAGENNQMHEYHCSPACLDALLNNALSS
jgi:hypothetical protein